VTVTWNSFAVATEIGIMTNGTLVPNTSDVFMLIFAKWSIAIDANMASLSHMWFGDGIVDGGKTVSWMNVSSTLDTIGTKVPIRAVETLVSYAVDCLVTSITNSGMTNITAWGTEKLCSRSHQGFSSRWLECVAWMVSVIVTLVARHAQIVIIAVLTSDKVILCEFCGKS